MKTKTAILSVLLSIIACGAFGASSEEYVIKNAGLTRTVSISAGILKTTKLEANGVQVFDLPSVEFMIEVENNGETTTLIPSDFDIKELHKNVSERQNSITALLVSHNEYFPVQVEVDYTADFKSDYQQKQIRIMPSSKPKGAVIRRVSIDDCLFKADYMPLTTSENINSQGVPEYTFNYNMRSNFGAYDPKTNKGFYFYVDSPKPVCDFNNYHDMSLCEEVDVPLSKGYDSSVAILGSVQGSPDAVVEKYRELSLENQFAQLDKAKEFASFKKAYNTYFSACKYTSSDNISKEIRIVDSKGILILTNISKDAQKISLPISSLGIKSKDGLNVYDLSTLNSSTKIDLSGDKIDLELSPNVPRIIGLNLSTP